MRRTLFIGDVHGCRHELEDLLDACAHVPADALVFVGDLVAKGPDSPGVLALARKLHARGVRGNHDNAVLRWRDAVLTKSAPARDNHHLHVARQLSSADWQLLSALPLFLRLPEHGALVVHAGVVPGVAIERQLPDLLMNMRTLRPDGTGSRRPDDGPLWGTAWPGPELVIFGHHAMAGLQRHPHAIGIDTGCVYGGRLTAYLLPDDRLVSVPARTVYASVADAERRGLA
jgi:diadenosine tetraphosphatase ApaH/serine/threonine PP2A family protein phosphatase